MGRAGLTPGSEALRLCCPQTQQMLPEKLHTVLGSGAVLIPFTSFWLFYFHVGNWSEMLQGTWREKVTKKFCFYRKPAVDQTQKISSQHGPPPPWRPPAPAASGRPSGSWGRPWELWGSWGPVRAEMGSKWGWLESGTGEHLKIVSILSLSFFNGRKRWNAHI